MLSISITILLTINVIVALLLVLVVLMQRPKNEGLGAAFGGGMMEDAFGAQTTNVLTNLTRWLGAIFFLVSLILTYLYSNFANTSPSSLDQRLRAAAPPPALATPAPAADGTLPGALPAPAGDASAPPLSLEVKPESLPAPGLSPGPAETPAPAAAPAPAPAPVAPQPPGAQ